MDSSSSYENDLEDSFDSLSDDELINDIDINENEHVDDSFTHTVPSAKIESLKGESTTLSLDKSKNRSKKRKKQKTVATEKKTSSFSHVFYKIKSLCFNIVDHIVILNLLLLAIVLNVITFKKNVFTFISGYTRTFIHIVNIGNPVNCACCARYEINKG